MPAALLYNMDLSGTGTSTGSFVPLFGDGDYETALAQIDPEATSYLHFTLANLTGKLPATLGVQQGYSQIDNAPLVGGSTGILITKGHASLKVNKNGIVTASLTGMSFTEKTMANKKVAFTGDYTLTSGKLSVNPYPATSGTAQPGVIALLNTHFALAGPDAYSNESPGNANPVSIKRGSSKTLLFILQNNGPSTDNFVLKPDLITPGFSLHFYDGKTDVTSQAAGSGGYAINAFPSGGMKLIKVKVTVARTVPHFDNQVIDFYLARAADSTVRSYGGAFVFVK